MTARCEFFLGKTNSSGQKNCNDKQHKKNGCIKQMRAIPIGCEFSFNLYLHSLSLEPVQRLGIVVENLVDDSRLNFALRFERAQSFDL